MKLNYPEMMEYDRDIPTEEEMDEEELFYQTLPAYKLVGSNEIRCVECTNGLEMYNRHTSLSFERVNKEDTPNECFNCGRQMKWMKGEY